MSREYLVLDAVAGPVAGRRFRCGAERETTFGRTGAAMVALEEDFYLSRVHFGVRYDSDQQTWHVRDLKSRHGTFLNGERIREAAVSPGDALKAGKTEFVVKESQQRDSLAGAAVAGAGVALFAAIAASKRPPDGKPVYERSECPSGLVTLVGAEELPAPASIAWLLARETPLFLLADFAKSSYPLPPQLERVDYLFNWMDDEVLPFCSPILLGPDDPIDPYEVIDEFWGQTTLLCLFSDLEKQELLVRLRAAIRRDDGLSTEVPKGMLGYCWPDAARPVLEAAPERLTEPLMGTSQAVLVEAESPNCWQVFCKPDEEQLVKSGLGS